jgi:hypothetical protein
LAGSSRHDVEEAGAVDVDERRGHLDAPTRVGVLERVLIHAQLRRRVESLIRGDEGVAVVDDGLMRARPANPELAGDPRHGVEVVADTPADLAARPLGQRRPGRDVRRRLRPRSPWTQRFAAAPGALGPHQHRRRPGDGQIPHHHPPAAVTGRSHTADRAPHPIVHGLDRQPQLTIAMHMAGDGEAAHAHERDRAQPIVTTVAHVGGLLLQMSDIRRMARPPTHVVDPINRHPSRHTPNVQRVEPVISDTACDHAMKRRPVSSLQVGKVDGVGKRQLALELE